MLVSGVALMVGALASSGAQAQCTGSGIGQVFPFGYGSGVNALTSVIGTVNTAFLTGSSAFVSAPGGAAPDSQGGGVWVRDIAGTATTQANSTFNGSFSLTSPLLTPPTASATGTDACHTKVRQDFVGFQAGQDISVLNGGSTGANFHFGAMAGYVQATFSDQSPSGPISPSGSLTGNFQVPFAGLYTVFTKGNFVADGQARLDYFQGELSDPNANGIFNQRLDARGYSFTGNVAYRFDLPQKWFIEPSVGGVISRVSADPFDVSGTALSGTGVSFPGSVQIHDIDSELGRASLRVGTSFTSDDGLAVMQPFFTASVYHEFAGNVTAAVTSQGALSVNNTPVAEWQGSGNLTTSRIGTYGQFGVGSAFQFVNTGWLGYGRVDYRTGDNIQGVSVNAGLRYQLNSETASLKDGGGLKDGPSDWSGYNWTGPYVGASAGGTRGTENWNLQDAGLVSPDFAGYLLGGQAGYNYQFGRFVTGFEGDFGFSNARGAKGCPGAAINFFYSCEANIEDLGSLTARLGYTWGRALFYAKGGWAFGDVTAQLHVNPGSTLGGLATSASTTNWENGWTAGGGMEFALTDRWSAKAEYMHYELNKDSFHVANSAVDGSPLSAETGAAGDTVRVGVNYHLGH